MHRRAGGRRHRALDLPAEAVLNPLSTVRFVAPAGHSFDYTTATTEAVVIDRAAFDAALGRRAELAGASLIRGRRVIAIEVVAGAAQLTFADDEPVRARSVILACGANYVVPEATRARACRRRSCSRRNSSCPPSVSATWRSISDPRSRRKGFAWAVPVRRSYGTFARIGVMAESDPAAYFSRMLARVRDRWGVAVPDAAAPRRRMLPLGSVKRTYAERVLAVGDAAGLVKPTTGGGIYYSVVSGEIAAEVLGSRLAVDDLSANAMREYEQRWRTRFQSEFTAQLALRFVAQRMRDADIDALFSLATTDGILPLVRQTARFNRHRDFILALLRHQPARRALFGRLASSA